MNTGWDFETLDLDIEELEMNLDLDFGDFGFESGFVEWDSGVGELTEDSYNEPEKKLLRCPNCDHVDSAERFKQA